MGIAACDLSQHVIRPTLLYLERHSATAEALLLGAAACQSALGSALNAPRATACIESAKSVIRHSGIGTWPSTRNWPAEYEASPASMPFSKHLTWN